jgi:hypothetical protein
LKPQIIFTVLFFLLTSTVLGTVIYSSFCKEQDKFIPKDKYDEAWNEVFRNKRKNLILGVRFNAIFGDSATISLGLGVLSCLILCSLLIIVDDSSFYLIVAPFFGSIAALIGFFIGAFEAFSTKNGSPLMRYGGVILCTVGLINIPVTIAVSLPFFLFYGY